MVQNTLSWYLAVPMAVGTEAERNSILEMLVLHRASAIALSTAVITFANSNYRDALDIPGRKSG